jgi:hypothetical protein
MWGGASFCFNRKEGGLHHRRTNETLWLNIPIQAFACTVIASISPSLIQAQLRNDRRPVIACIQFGTTLFRGLPAQPADFTEKAVNAIHRARKNEGFSFHHNACRNVHISYKQLHFGFDSNGQGRGAVLKQGVFNNKKIFWIESHTYLAANNNEFVLEFCSNGISINSKPKTYFEKKEYQSEISIGKDLIKGSSSGSEVKISILGAPGETIELDSIRFGNNPSADITSQIHHKNQGHIIEFKAIVPDYKIEKVVSIVATVVEKSSPYTTKHPITIEQSFTINEGLNSMAKINVE